VKIKKSWERERKIDIPVEVMNNIAARGSFVVVRSKDLYRDFNTSHTDIEIDSDGLSISEQINQKIKQVNFKMWMENISDNISAIRRSGDISKIPKKTGKTAIIVGAGPSFWEKGHLDLIKKAQKKFSVITTDRMLVPLLESGVEPDIVVTVDGQREHIISFYDNDLVNEGLSTIGVMAVTVAPNVVNRFKGSKFFFTPMIDEIDKNISLSTAISYMTRTTILSTGGNVGITSIYLAFYLGYKNIILTGIDLGYTKNTPVEKSAYYPIVKEVDPDITPEKYKELFIIEGYNPDFKVEYYTDMTWKPHIDDIIRQSRFMKQKGVNIINSTEGGSLHGGAIEGIPLEEAMNRYEA